VVEAVRVFAEREIRPLAAAYEREDRYPFELVEKMKEMGLFGAIIPQEYGGLGLDYVTYARIIEEITRVWMSVAGILNSHLIMAWAVLTYGTEAQRRRYLPRFATGERRGGLCLTEPDAGSDVQGIRTTARRDGDGYRLNGAKMFITNGRYGDTYLVLARTDPAAMPPRRGMSLFVVEKGPGFVVLRDIPKLGYRGVETCEIRFEDVYVPADNLVGGEEGQGFRQVLGALEVGRINVAARGVGLARAAFEAAIRYADQRQAFGQPIAEFELIQKKLAWIATKIEAARLLTLRAAERKARGERADLEAGMAKLFATETAQEAALEAMRIHGGYGYTEDFPVERYYRDAPLLVIGEGTNEIQETVIARQLLRRFRAGEDPGGWGP
jgi:alkylation response protein AidB-like acyl-CoA dehydrogenase